MRLKGLVLFMALAVSSYAGASDNFFKAVVAGKVKLAERHLIKGADVNARYISEKAEMSYGETAVIIAASAGNKEMVRMLLKRGADPNITNEGYSAIIYAATYGHTDIVKMLVENGANINQIHVDGTTPLINAVLTGNIELVKLLLEMGADTSIKDYGGKTAEDYAEKDEIKELLKNTGKPER